MRISIFILICFTVIIALGNISLPLRVDEPISGIYQRTLLPGALSFAFICLALVIVILFLEIKTMAKPISSELKLKRKDLNLTGPTIVIAIWYVFITILFFTRIHVLNLSLGSNWHYLIVLLSILVYLIIIKIRIRAMSPDAWGIIGADIYSKRIFGYKHHQLNRMKSVHYLTKNNTVLLVFNDGLENIELPLSDYEISAVTQFIERIRELKGDALKLEESYRKWIEK